MKYSSPAIKITKFEYEEILAASSEYEETTLETSSYNDDLPQEEF